MLWCGVFLLRYNHLMETHQICISFFFLQTFKRFVSNWDGNQARETQERVLAEKSWVSIRLHKSGMRYPEAPLLHSHSHKLNVRVWTPVQFFWKDEHKHTHICTRSTHYPLADLCNSRSIVISAGWRKQDNVKAQGAACWGTTMKGFMTQTGLIHWLHKSRKKKILPVQSEEDWDLSCTCLIIVYHHFYFIKAT